MRHFDEFLAGENAPLSAVFTDKARLHEAADIIQKLQLIAQELPPKQVSEASSEVKMGFGNAEQIGSVKEWVLGCVIPAA